MCVINDMKKLYTPPTVEEGFDRIIHLGFDDIILMGDDKYNG